MEGFRLEKVVRAQDGDKVAFEALVYEFTPKIYRLARAMLGESAAPDAVQDTFFAVWRELPRLRDPSRFEPWLHRIAVNRCRSMLRSRRRIMEISLESAHDAFAARDLRSDAETRALLMPALLGLSVDHRTVVALHYAAGLTIAETATVLMVPEGTVKSRLNAAFEMLRRALTEATRD